MTINEQETRCLNNIDRLEKTILKTPISDEDLLESKFLLLDDEKGKLQGLAVTE